MENKLDTVNSDITALNAANTKSQNGTETSFKELNKKLTVMGVTSINMKKTVDDLKVSFASDDEKT